MELDRSPSVCFGSFFLIGEATKQGVFAVLANLSVPSAVSEIDPFVPTLVRSRFLAVADVLALRRSSQIAGPVIEAVAVSVIYDCRHIFKV